MWLEGISFVLFAARGIWLKKRLQPLLSSGYAVPSSDSGVFGIGSPGFYTSPHAVSHLTEWTTKYYFNFSRYCICNASCRHGV